MVLCSFLYFNTNLTQKYTSDNDPKNEKTWKITVKYRKKAIELPQNDNYQQKAKTHLKSTIQY